MQITLFHLFISLLLVAIPSFILYYFGSNLIVKVWRSWLKMLVSLTLMGGILHFVVAQNNVLLTLTFALFIILGTALFTILKAKLSFFQLFIPVFSGMIAAIVFGSIFVLALLVGFKTMFEVRYFVPIVTLLTGHLMETNSKALHLFYVGLKHHGTLYHYLLGNGATQMQALRYLMRRSIERSALTSLSNMGLMLLGSSPIIMWSMVLSGETVVSAAMSQAIILMAFLCTSIVSVAITLIVARKYVLDHHHQLKESHQNEP